MGLESGRFGGFSETTGIGSTGEAADPVEGYDGLPLHQKAREWDSGARSFTNVAKERLLKAALYTLYGAKPGQLRRRDTAIRPEHRDQPDVQRSGR